MANCVIIVGWLKEGLQVLVEVCDNPMGRPKAWLRIIKLCNGVYVVLQHPYIGASYGFGARNFRIKTGAFHLPCMQINYRGGGARESGQERMSKRPISHTYIILHWWMNEQLNSPLHDCQVIGSNGASWLADRPVYRVGIVVGLAQPSNTNHRNCIVIRMKSGCRVADGESNIRPARDLGCIKIQHFPPPGNISKSALPQTDKNRTFLPDTFVWFGGVSSRFWSHIDPSYITLTSESGDATSLPTQDP